jgi:hypothetical protein
VVVASWLCLSYAVPQSKSLQVLEKLLKGKKRGRPTPDPVPAPAEEAGSMDDDDDAVESRVKSISAAKKSKVVPTPLPSGGPMGQAAVTAGGPSKEEQKKRKKKKKQQPGGQEGGEGNTGPAEPPVNASKQAAGPVSPAADLPAPPKPSSKVRYFQQNALYVGL